MKKNVEADNLVFDVKFNKTDHPHAGVWNFCRIADTVDNSR